MFHRSARASDTDQLTTLWANAGVSHGEETDRQEIQTRLMADDGLFVVGVDDTGAIRCSAMGCYDNHRGWVKRFVVDPDLGRKGHGRTLLDELERRFIDAGITKLRLAVWSNNHDGAAFWEANGFSDIPDIRYMGKNLGD